MGVFYKLDFKRKKSEYKKSDEVPVVIIYYHNKKKLKVSTSVKVSQSHWNNEYKNTRSKNPVKKSDVEHKQKNLELSSKLTELENIIHKIKVSGTDEPTTDLVKSLLLKNEYKRIESTLTKVHFSVLFKEYRDWFFSDEYLVITNNRDSYRTALKTSFEDITNYTFEYQNKHKIKLLLENIDLEWISKFIDTITKTKGYLPSTVNKRIKVLRLFRSWLRDTKRISFNLIIPKKRFTEPNREVICFNHKEILQIHNFKEFDASNDKHIKHLRKKDWVEVVYIDDKRNRIKKSATVSYTNYEVYKDMLVWMCVTGMRFSDTINLTVLSKQFNSEDRKLGEIKYTSIKTGRLIYVPLVNITQELFEKYSSGKTAEQKLFPPMGGGSSISNQKINKHIKTIIEIIGIRRLVKNPKFGSDGLPIEGTDKPQRLSDMVTTHIGRRSFIRYHIEKGTPVHTIKSMTGHRSTKVFERYFSVISEDRMKSMDYNFTLGEGFSTIKKESKKQKPTVGLTEDKKEELQGLKTALDNGWIPEDEWKKEVKKVLNS